MRAIALPFVTGVIFAVGLVIGGMTQPAKVVAFLDFAGSWDASLALVMASAVATYFFLHRLVLRRRKPIFAAQYLIPTRRDLDAKLIVGSVLFGAGWGLAGFCPGPALTSIGTAAPTVLIFVAAMLAGMFLHGTTTAALARRAKTQTAAQSADAQAPEAPRKAA